MKCIQERAVISATVKVVATNKNNLLMKLRNTEIRLLSLIFNKSHIGPMLFV